MASQDENSQASPNEAFVEHLQASGFFQQISNLETSLTSIVEEIQAFSTISNQRQEESENIAAHILAMEAILATVLKTHPVQEADLMQEIDRQAAALTGDGKPNPTVEAIAMDLLRKSQIEG